MRIPHVLAILAIIAAFGCGTEAPKADSSSAPGPEAASARVYDLEGTIISRDAAASTLTIRHGAIGDWMGPMTMTFPVRGVSVASLPADGATIRAKVHVASNGDFWVSDVGSTPAGDPVLVPAAPTDTSDTSATVSEEISL